ncbi:hypothetical protein GCM10010274_01140 [Streptomyces lavendofoliae]|uniref:Uncharacterized protein n=1 Tax=Streptomyces lavendofoliae TaxID=67314 RepID=A0A918M192_9ACTN|nr:hypothetical protein GCM10010274_01140 [Streptomyces lavendofoliae]
MFTRALKHAAGRTGQRPDTIRRTTANGGDLDGVPDAAHRAAAGEAGSVEPLRAGVRRARLAGGAVPGRPGGQGVRRQPTVPPDWYGTPLKGVCNFRPDPTVLQATAWALVSGPGARAVPVPGRVRTVSGGRGAEGNR